MLPDGDDDMVLETAVNGQADMLVTMNRRDFEPAVGAFTLRLVPPAEAVRRLRRTR
jgi:predicted nucleic acid-binding protein